MEQNTIETSKNTHGHAPPHSCSGVFRIFSIHPTHDPPPLLLAICRQSTLIVLLLHVSYWSVTHHSLFLEYEYA